MAVMMKFLVLFVLLIGIKSQQYESHTVQPVLKTQVFTVTETVIVTHTLRETTTTDVWGTEYNEVVATGTQYVTDWDFLPIEPRTYTSIVRVTSTPIIFDTATVFIHSILTETSAFTSFLTTTETVDLVQSITHVAVAHLVHTVPVVTTQMLHQEILTTVTQIVTTTITSTTLYG